MTDIEAAIETAKKALEEHKEHAEELQKAYDELLQASHKIAEKLYKQQAPEGEQPGAGQAGPESSQDEPKGEGPIDADIEE